MTRLNWMQRFVLSTEEVEVTITTLKVPFLRLTCPLKSRPLIIGVLL